MRARVTAARYTLMLITAACSAAVDSPQAPGPIQYVPAGPTASVGMQAGSATAPQAPAPPPSSPVSAPVAPTPMPAPGPATPLPPPAATTSAAAGAQQGANAAGRSGNATTGSGGAIASTGRGLGTRTRGAAGSDAVAGAGIAAAGTGVTASAGSGAVASGSFDAGSGELQPDGKIVIYRIPNGTGGKDWNRKDDPIRVKHGMTLRLIDEDKSTRAGGHWLHTYGQPCPHGTREIGTGYDCAISQRAPAGLQSGVFEHNVANGIGNLYIDVVAD